MAIVQKSENGWETVCTGINVHVAPCVDSIPHILCDEMCQKHHCPCGPRWRAEYNRERESVVWVFVHNSLDGREQLE